METMETQEIQSQVDSEGSLEDIQSESMDVSGDPAQNPDIVAAFDRLFGTTNTKTSTRRSERARTQQETEELDDENADELDDNVEPSEESSKEEKKEPVRKETPEKKAKSDYELSPVLRQAAKQAGMEDDDINAILEKDPELAQRTFSNLLRTYNDISLQLSQLGSVQAEESQRKADERASRPAIEKETDDLLTSIYGDKAKTFAETYGQDFVQDVLSPIVQVVGQMMQHTERQQTEAVASEIGSFFRGMPEEFQELYGGAKVTDEQFKARRELAFLADQIKFGASRQGLNLSVSESLQRANMLYSAEHMSKIERKKIVDQLKKRSQSITQPPSQRNIPSEQRPSEQRAAEVFDQRARELGWT